MPDDTEDLRHKYNSFLKNMADSIEKNASEEFNRGVDEVVSEVKALIKRRGLE